MKFSDPPAVYKGRHPCPSCGKKGLGFAAHPHAYGHKDRFICRYCKKVFKRKEKYGIQTDNERQTPTKAR